MNKNIYDWSSINGDKYFKLTDIIYSEDEDEITKQAEMVAVIEDCTVDDVLDMPIEEAALKFSQLIFLNKFELISNYHPTTITVGDVKYRMCDVTKMNVAQFVDYQNYITQPFRDAYYQILSVFIIPDGCNYNEGYDISDVQMMIRTMLSWREIQSLLNFIIREFVRSLMSSRRSLLKRVKMMSRENKEKVKAQIVNLDKMMSDLISIRGIS